MRVRWATALFALLPAVALPEGRLRVRLFPRSPVAGWDAVVEVHVFDALTGEPVEGAVVELRSPPLVGVEEVEGRTREDGRARLPLSARRGGPLTVEVRAVGYEPTRLSVLVRFRRLPPSAIALSLLGLAAFWGGALLCSLRALRRGPREGDGRGRRTPS